MKARAIKKRACKRQLRQMIQARDFERACYDSLKGAQAYLDGLMGKWRESFNAAAEHQDWCISMFSDEA